MRHAMSIYSSVNESMCYMVRVADDDKSARGYIHKVTKEKGLMYSGE